jgi:hypothetical protein
MRRACIRRRFYTLFFQAEEPLGQPVELGAYLLDDLPLFRQLIRQFLDRLCLMRDRFLKPGDAFAVVAHDCPRGQPFVCHAIPYHIHMFDKVRVTAILRFIRKCVNRAGLSRLNWEEYMRFRFFDLRVRNSMLNLYQLVKKSMSGLLLSKVEKPGRLGEHGSI